MKKCFLVFCVLLICISFCSCEEKKEKFSVHSFDYFDTVSSITGYADDKESFDRVSEEIFDKLEEYHKLYTIYHRYEGLENLCTVNELRDGAHRTVTVDQKIVDLLLYSKDIYYKTDGRVNIAMGSVLSIWHDYRTLGMDNPAEAKIPPMEKLMEASLHTDIEDIIIDEENNTVTLADPEMKLDVGAVAKGYATEMIAQYLEEKGITGYVLNVGGNVRTIGCKDDGSEWTVGIENPSEDETEPYFAYLKLSGESLVTSGSYQRYYIVDGKRYHHIIDPETLMPSDLYLSVSVITASSADADALSTALFCMTPEKGLELIESVDGAEAFWVGNDGTEFYSSGFMDYSSD